MWLMVCFAPFVNVLFPIGTILAERISYAPSVGYALGVGWALDGARRHLGYRVVQRLGLALLLVLGLRTAARCTDWRDELQLFGAVVAANPESARGHKGLAKALQDAGRVAEAEQEYRSAIEIYPRFDTAHYNLAILLHGTARYEEALSHFDRACILRPEFADAHLNRGVTLSRLGRLQESRQATQRAAELRPEWDAPRVNLQEINTAIDRQGEQR
jgi:tetratricopeptide (TPR) repeat protein